MRRRHLFLISNLLLTLVSALCFFFASVEISGFNAGIRIYFLEQRGAIVINPAATKELVGASDNISIGRYVAQSHILTQSLLGSVGLICALLNWNIYLKNRRAKDTA